MKFFGKNSLSSVLYWISTLCFSGFMLGLIIVLTSLISQSYSIRVNNEFAITIPYTEMAIKGEYNPSTFVVIIASIIFYGLFFYILRAIFKVFSKEEYLFTKKTMYYMKGFALINIIFPPLAVIAGYIIRGVTDFEVILQNGLHVLLGIFCLFVVAVFNKGIVLQEDTNLTI